MNEKIDKEKILNTSIDSPVELEATFTNRKGEKIKAKVLALEGVYCKALSSLGSKIYGSTQDNLEDLIKNETQLFELCLKYGYKEWNEDDKDYVMISIDKIKEIIQKDFKYAQSVYLLVQGLTLQLNTAENEEKKKPKKS